LVKSLQRMPLIDTKPHQSWNLNQNIVHSFNHISRKQLCRNKLLEQQPYTKYPL